MQQRFQGSDHVAIIIGDENANTRRF